MVVVVVVVDGSEMDDAEIMAGMVDEAGDMEITAVVVPESVELEN